MPKLLSEYPQPKDSTGFGLHGCASNVHGGLREHKSDNPETIALFKRMGVTWVKLVVGGDNAVDTCQLLVANGIMPIVRFYVPEQWPRPLSSLIDLAHLSRLYADAGAVYQQVGNEPNLLLEWLRGWGTSDADPTPWKEGAIPDRVADCFAIDAAIILDNGGIPLTAPLSPGGNYNDIDFFRTFCEVLRNKGHRALLERGVCIGAHPGTTGHPLDYPFDKVNQEGEQLTREEYERHSTWAGSLEWVNAERLRGKNPGQHLLSVHPMDHPNPLLRGKDSGGSNCWNKYQAYAAIWEQVFGFQVPVISLEGGAWVGEKIGPEPYNDVRIPDPRYPAVSKEDQADLSVAILRQFSDGQVPDYFFNTMFWLSLNKDGGNTHEPFERDAWWGYYWDGGHLPVVDRLLAEPALPRSAYQGGVVVVPPSPVPTVLSFDQVAAFVQRQGFVGEERVTMTALVFAESTGLTTAVGLNKDEAGNVLSEDLGPAQINSGWIPDLMAAGLIRWREDLFDPDKNLAAARYVYQIQGFGAWTTYGGARYLAALPAARAAVAALDAAGSPTPAELHRFAYERCLGLPDDSALMREGRRLGLLPLSKEVTGTISCGFITGQIFGSGSQMVMLYCLDGLWDKVYRADL